MRRISTWVVVTAVVLGLAATTANPISIGDTHRQIELFVRVPDDATEIGVVVECEHMYQSSARAVAGAGQEWFVFRHLHGDTYGVVVQVAAGGKTTRVERTVFVTE